MREILFRGKPLGKKHFVEGNLGVINDNLYAIYWCNEFIDDTRILVDTQTVGQYTGLTDKNGTKIFEGDIVKIIDTYNNCVVWYVDYKPTAFCINQKGVNYSDYLGKCNNGKYEVEVIGNIHDNPELLNEFQKGDKK